MNNNSTSKILAAQRRSRVPYVLFHVRELRVMISEIHEVRSYINAALPGSGEKILAGFVEMLAFLRASLIMLAAVLVP
jgi:hypothetical protein